jgi:hypothetical protein
VRAQARQREEAQRLERAKAAEKEREKVQRRFLADRIHVPSDVGFPGDFTLDNSPPPTTLNAAALALGSSPPFAVNVTNTTITATIIATTTSTTTRATTHPNPIWTRG